MLPRISNPRRCGNTVERAVAFRTGTYTNSLQAMALWQPANGFRKGGIGAYQMQNDFKNDCYKYFRAAINAMDKLEKGGTEADDQQ